MRLTGLSQMQNEQTSSVNKKRNKSNWNPHRSNDGKEQCQTYGFVKLNPLKEEQPSAREAKEDKGCEHERAEKGYKHVSKSVGVRPPLKLPAAMWAGKETYGLAVQFNLVRAQGALKQNHVPLTGRERISLRPVAWPSRPF